MSDRPVGGQSVSPAQYRARVKVAKEVLAAGGSAVHAAKRLSMRLSALVWWLKRNEPELQKALAKQGKRGPKAGTRVGVYRPPLTPERKRERLALAKAVLAEQKGSAEFARRAGVLQSTAVEWLKANAPEIFEKMREFGAWRTLPREEIVRRLKIVQRIATRKGAAHEIGIEPPALSFFLARYAPDGAAAALVDYLDEAA